VKRRVREGGCMHSSELARLANVSADTIRYYERKRLLPAAERSAAGYRLFSPEALTRVLMIRGALSVGFSVKELAEIFGIRDEGGSPCHRVRRLGAIKLRELEATLLNLRLKRNELKKTLALWDGLLKATPHGKRAGLLEVFAHAKEKSK
jgi:DNA-binding transcriptional MerR regulator